MGDIVKYFFKKDGVPHECLYDVESHWKTGDPPNYPLTLERIWRKVPGSERECEDEGIVKRLSSDCQANERSDAE